MSKKIYINGKVNLISEGVLSINKTEKAFFDKLNIEGKGKIVNNGQVICKGLTANGVSLDMSMTKNGYFTLPPGEYTAELLQQTIEELNHLKGCLIGNEFTADNWC